MERIPRLFLVALLLGLSLPADAEGPSTLAVAAGPELGVPARRGEQRFPALLPEPDGGFLVLWAGYDDGEPFWKVSGRRLDTKGAAHGKELRIGAYTAAHGHRPAVARLPDGGFLVVWQAVDDDSDDSDDIFARRWSAEWQSGGEPFQVNARPLTAWSFPAAAVAADGSFVVVWHSKNSAGSDQGSLSIQARRFASDATPRGDDFQVNVFSPSYQQYPAVAAVPSEGTSGFVVVWESDGSAGSDTSNLSIHGRRFAADGTPLAGELQVNGFTTGSQRLPGVAVAQDGRFVVAWESQGSAGDDTSGRSIQGQLFAAAGDKLGGQFQVNATTAGGQHYPAVAFGGDGGFVVAWDSEDSSGSYVLRARRFTLPKEETPKGEAPRNGPRD